METVGDTFSRLDILVNNVGVTSDNNAVYMTENDFDDTLVLNLKGTFFALVDILHRRVLRSIFVVGEEYQQRLTEKDPNQAIERAIGISCIS